MGKAAGGLRLLMKTILDFLDMKILLILSMVLGTLGGLFAFVFVIRQSKKERDLKRHVEESRKSDQVSTQGTDGVDRDSDFPVA